MEFIFFIEKKIIKLEIKLIYSLSSAGEQEVIARCLNTEKGKRELRTLEEKHRVTIDVIPCKEIKVKVIEDVSTR